MTTKKSKKFDFKKSTLHIPSGYVINKMITTIISYVKGVGNVLINLGSSIKTGAQNRINSLLERAGLKTSSMSREKKLKLLKDIREEIDEEIEKTKDNVEVRLDREEKKVYRIENTSNISTMSGSDSIFNHLKPMLRDIVNSSHFPFKINIAISIDYRNVKSENMYPYVLKHKAEPIVMRREFNEKYNKIADILYKEFLNPVGVPSGCALDRIKFTDVHLNFYELNLAEDSDESLDDEE